MALLATGCSGAAFVTGVHDPGSNYTNGVGLRLEATTAGQARPVVRLGATTATKGGADGGYTYSGSAGARYGQRWYGEAGYAWFGYRSDFGDAQWASDDGTAYGRVGYDSANNWAVAATYYPPFGGVYNTDELRLESRIAIGRFVMFVEPAFYRMTLPKENKRVKDAALRAGVGLRW